MLQNKTQNIWNATSLFTRSYPLKPAVQLLGKQSICSFHFHQINIFHQPRQKGATAPPKHPKPRQCFWSKSHRSRAATAGVAKKAPRANLWKPRLGRSGLPRWTECVWHFGTRGRFVDGSPHAKFIYMSINKVTQRSHCSSLRSPNLRSKVHHNLRIPACAEHPTREWRNVKNL